MPLPTDHKSGLSRLKKLSAAVALSLALPAGVQAAALGKLTVLSSLGQPLRAEIELTAVSKEEEGALVARLASADAFNKANIDFNPVLSSLRFSVEQRQGRQLIRITSSQPVNEPFVDLLLELSGGGSRVMREYTFLLDPSDMHKPQAAQAAPVAPAAATVETKPETKPVMAPSAKPVAAPSASVVVKQAAAADDGDQEPVPKFERKDAPSSQAEEIIRNRSNQQTGQTNAPAPGAVAEKPASAPVNSEGGKQPVTPARRDTRVADKAGDKTYRVKEGDTLADIANRNRSKAVSLDQMLIALYRANPDAFIGDNINRVRAGQVLSVPDMETAAAVDKGEAHSTVVAQARDFNAYRNKLAGQVASGPSRKSETAGQTGSGKITTRVEEKSTTGGARDRLQLSKSGVVDRAGAEKAAAEQKIAADKAIAEANDRVKALERNVSDLQKLLEIKNKSLAEMSAQQKAAAAAAAPAVPAPQARPEETPAPVKPEPVAPVAEPVKPEPVAAPAPAPVGPAAEPTKRTITTGPAAKAGFFDRVQENPFVLPGAGALVALLAGWGFVRARNKKKAAEAAAGESSEEGEAVEETVAAAVSGQDESDIAEEPAVEAAAAEEVDPIAEADMYISYGRDEQAEDILHLALKTDPDRQAIHGKLLEIYARRKDVDSFNDVARQLHGMTGGIGEEWEKAAARGIVLDPTNALYGGAPQIDEVPASVVEAEEPPVTVETTEPVPEVTEEEQGLEFDLNDFKAAEISPDATPPVNIASKIDFDLELDSGVKPDEDTATAPAAPVVNAIDLDLPAVAENPQPVDVLEDDESAFAAEMSTKLDLAAAYQEIGDKEGARELLEEVMRGGNDGQIERARDMLSKLS